MLKTKKFSKTSPVAYQRFRAFLCDFGDKLIYSEYANSKTLGQLSKEIPENLPNPAAKVHIKELTSVEKDCACRSLKI